MLNKVILIGRLVSDVQSRETQNGIKYTYFTLAVNRPRSNDQTDFIDCIAWRGTVDILEKYTKKGSLIAVEGRIEVYKTESNGTYNTRTNVNVMSITLLDSRGNNSINASRPEVEPSPFEEPSNVSQPNNPGEQQKTISNDDSSSSFEINFDEIKF